MANRPIRFFHQGSIVAIEGAAPTRTVLEWLREDARCSGTKEGCNEGDCGACTVVLGELVAGAGAGEPASLRLETVNACIQFLPALDGKALFTVEDVAGSGRAAPLDAASLHPLQQAMVDCHASQCGFCTPGFVMSLWAAYERHLDVGTRPSRQRLADELAGNLCRCTGYRPILDAGERMFDAAPTTLDRAPALAALLTLADDPPLDYVAGGARCEAPRSLAALSAARLARPDARLVAGSTDIGLWVNKGLRELPDLIFTGAVDELRRIETTATTLVIGAAASLEDAYRALVARWPALLDLWLRFASPPIRHAGTLGGNLANGSPIGDSAPILLALDARLLLRCGDSVRRLALASFYRGYMENALAPGEFLQAVEVPLDSAAVVRAYKVAKRFDSDISAVCAGFALTLVDGRIASARLAFGGMAAVVRRAAGAEAALLGQSWDEAALHAARLALASDFAPLSDLRASAAYRSRVAANLLRRFWLETRAESPLPASALEVWAAVPRAESLAEARR